MKKKRCERDCCLNCIHRDYESFWGTSWVVVKKSCPWYAPWKDGNVRESSFICKDYKRKTETEFNLKYKEGDVVYIIASNYDTLRTPPVTKHKITKVNPYILKCPYAIKLKDDEGTFEVWAEEKELYSSYDEAFEAEKENLITSAWKLDEEYRAKNIKLSSKMDYLTEYKGKVK